MRYLASNCQTLILKLNFSLLHHLNHILNFPHILEYSVINNLVCRLLDEWETSEAFGPSWFRRNSIINLNWNWNFPSVSFAWVSITLLQIIHKTNQLKSVHCLFKAYFFGTEASRVLQIRYMRILKEINKDAMIPFLCNFQPQRLISWSDHEDPLNTKSSNKILSITRRRGRCPPKRKEFNRIISSSGFIFNRYMKSTWRISHNEGERISRNSGAKRSERF